MLQAVLKESTTLYNPHRDIAHCFPTIVTETARRLEVQAWPPVAAYLTTQGVTDDDLAKACEAFITFVGNSVGNPQETMEAALRRSGWFDVPEPAQVAYMAYFGTVVAGLAFRGVREATLGGKGPVSNLDDLRAAGAQASRLLTTPRWRRCRLLQRLKDAFHVLRKPVSH